ncbi:hypothetical protein [Blautia massiliensis (ex Durand et al. 2017)]|uniref:hypothetical protein n=1 Tax=Blautia massiliensis (ex Durand et al. 2017) TaxID=1737424 RepID=UPI00156F3E1E|nr:hypothetical protein [Blautia massiliensis (ex Durand et al. 2017)]NSG49330.1 hypothetical protein [Blautia massiliensis (ex Durand et al. 2017)]NSL01136.1 hypothetical protein [Blautia massiliensis (ex Durand et al. 2017)]
MADQNITALPAATSPASSDQLLLVGATEEKLIDYDKLADAILQKLTSKQYTLDQGTKTLPAALNELNSNPFLRYEKAFGESLTIKNVRAATHGLIIIEKTMVAFYLGGSINIGYTVTTSALPDGITVSNSDRTVTIKSTKIQMITCFYAFL